MVFLLPFFQSGRLFYAEQTGFYEDKTGFSTFIVHGGADGAVHADSVALQHCRQYLCGPAGNGGAYCGLSRLPAPEYCPVAFRGCGRRYQFGHRQKTW